MDGVGYCCMNVKSVMHLRCMLSAAVSDGTCCMLFVGATSDGTCRTHIAKCPFRRPNCTDPTDTANHQQHPTILAVMATTQHPRCGGVTVKPRCGGATVKPRKVVEHVLLALMFTFITFLMIRYGRRASRATFSDSASAPLASTRRRLWGSSSAPSPTSTFSTTRWGGWVARSWRQFAARRDEAQFHGSLLGSELFPVISADEVTLARFGVRMRSIGWIDVRVDAAGSIRRARSFAITHIALPGRKAGRRNDGLVVCHHLAPTAAALALQPPVTHTVL